MSEYIGLRGCVQNRILNDVFESCSASTPGWLVLIVDDEAMRVVSSVVGMYDIMEKKITTVESINNVRQPLPEMEVIYLITPSPASIDLLIADFANPKRPMYGSAHLYFLTRVEDKQMAKLKKVPNLLKRIKTFSEVNLNFITPTSHSFHLDMKPDAALKMLYSTSPNCSKIAAQLVTVCATMNEYPHIRYSATSPLCSETAQLFHEKMNAYMSQNPSWWFHGGQSHTQRSRSTLLLLDRAADPLTPIMHEFTYEAMVNDLLDIDEEKISYESEANSGEKVKKDVLLNENDELWKELRYMHIADVITTLSTRIRDFVGSNSGAALANNSGADMSLSEMAAALKQLPEYKETMSKLSQHMYLAHQCMDVFGKQGLLDLSELEQTMGTGTDAEGKAPKAKVLIDELIDHLAGISTRKQAIRLIMIYIISQHGITVEVRKRLFDAAGLTGEEQEIILNLEKLGVTLQQAKAPSKSFTSMFRSARLASTGRADKNSTYTMSRYVSNLKGVLEQVAEGKLDMKDYPSVLPMPPGAEKGGGGGARSVRRGGGGAVGEGKGTGNSRWAASSSEAAVGSKANSLANKKFTGGRIIAFTIGGLSHSEIRAGWEVMMGASGKEIVVGGTSFLKPDVFVDAIKGI